MRSGRTRATLCGLLGVSSWLLSSASLAQDVCSRLSIAGVRPGMAAGEVRDLLPVEATATEVVLPGGVRARVEEYALPEGTLYVEYDGDDGGRNRRVALVRQPLRPTYDKVIALVSRLGDPVAGRDSLVHGLAEPAVWIDAKCDAVVSYYRRSDWWAGDGMTVLRAERLSRLSLESPALAVVEEWRANGTSAPAAVASVDGAPKAASAAPKRANVAPKTASAKPAAVVPQPKRVVTATPVNAAPQRARYVQPVYPERAKKDGVTGLVTLRVFVQKNGKVVLARVSDVEPVGYGFEKAAVEAVEQWRFVPAKREGRDVDGQVDVVVRFP